MTRTVRFQSLKWPDRPHWEYDARWLGADAHGQWLGLETGTWLSRPGAGFHAHCEQVVVMPHDAWWCATFYGPDARRPVDIYVDIATPAEWSGDEVRCVDLDLDIIQGVSGRVWVDDEDEFAAHRVQYAYPDEVIQSALAARDEVLHLVEKRHPPFDGDTSLGWLARLLA